MGKIFNHPLTIIFITLCTIIFSLSMSRQSQNKIDFRSQKEILEEKNQNLINQKEILEFKKELSAKNIVQEKIIRDDLWRQKPGEIVLDLADFKRAAPKSPPPPPPSPSPIEEWQKIFYQN